MLKVKRFISLMICFVFVVGLIFSNTKLVLAAPVYYTPNSNASRNGISASTSVAVSNYGQWLGALNANGTSGEQRPFSNNSFSLENNYYLYQFQMKYTSQTTISVIKGTVSSAPTSMYYTTEGGRMSTHTITGVTDDDKSNNWKWFCLKNYVPNVGTQTKNTANNIQIKVSNIRIFQTDDEGNNGQWLNIDMVRTVTAFSDYGLNTWSAGPPESGYKGYQTWVALGKGITQVKYIGCKDVTVNNQFYLAGTNTPVNIKTNITCVDVDAGQTISFKKSAVQTHYLTNDTFLWYNSMLSSQNNNVFYNAPNDEVSNSPSSTIGFVLSGSSLEYSFGRNRLSPTMNTQFIGTINNMSATKYINPTKTITDSDEANVKSNNIRRVGESWTYNIEQTIPEVNASNFTSFSFRDYIDSCLSLNQNDILIEATDGVNTVNATDWFDVSLYNGTGDHASKRVDAVLKSSYVTSLNSQFYKYQTYRLKIPVKINGSLNSSASGSFIFSIVRNGHMDDTRSKLTFTNKAYTYINGEQKTTNEVDTTVHLPTKETDTPGLKITKVADKFEYQVGDKIHYAVEVSNTNPEADTAYFIIKDNTLPNTVEVDSDSFEINGISASNYDFEVDNNNWQLTSKSNYALPYGSTIKIEFDATALKPSNSHLVDNTATAFAFGVGEHQAEAEVWVNSPKLNVTKDADKTRFNLGDEITYTVEATNINEGTLTHLIFEDSITSTGVTYIANSVKVMGDDTDITNDCNISFNSTLSKLTIDTYHYLKNGDCELINQKNSRGRIGYQNGIAPRSHNKITLTYKVKVVNADTSYGTALLLTDEKVLDNTVKAIPGAIYNYDGSTPVIIKDDSTIPSGGDEATEEITINEPELSITKESNKDAYKVNNIAYYTLTIKQTKTNLIARNIGIRDTFDKDDGITLNKDSIKVFLNNVDVTNSCIIIKTPSSAHTNEFYINTLKSISDQDELKVTYNAKVEKTGYYDNNVTVSSTNTDSVTDTNEIEVQVNGLPMTGQERNLFFIFIGLGIVLTITLVIVRKKRKLSTK